MTGPTDGPKWVEGRCECEHVVHGDDGCKKTRVRLAYTVMGIFRLCEDCVTSNHMYSGE